MKSPEIDDASTPDTGFMAGFGGMGMGGMGMAGMGGMGLSLEQSQAIRRCEAQSGGRE